MTIAQILANAINIFFELLSFAIVIRCLLSWLPINRNSAILKFIYSFTEPILEPIRRIMNRSPLGGGMMIDFSPVIAVILLSVLQNILLRVILVIFL